jgi:hypothetical protein
MSPDAIGSDVLQLPSGRAVSWPAVADDQRAVSPGNAQSGPLIREHLGGRNAPAVAPRQDRWIKALQPVV